MQHMLEDEILAELWDDLATEIFRETGLLPYEAEIPVPANDNGKDRSL